VRVLGYYAGWNVLAGGFLSAALAVGFTSYIYGMFAVPVTAELGLSRAAYNNGFIGLSIGIALLSPIAGKLLDQYSPRLIIAIAGLLFGSSLVAISVQSDPRVILGLLLLPLATGVACCGVLGANTVVVKWFQRRRGRALGILALSTSVGGFLTQPITGWLITNLGWREALLIIGIVCAALFFLLALLAIRGRPPSHTPGYRDEFKNTAVTPAPTEEKSKQEDFSQSYGTILTTKNFWLVTIAIGIFFGVDQSILISQVPYFLDVGYNLETAAILVSVKTFSAIGGKLIVGFLADKVDLRKLYTGVALCNIALLTVYVAQPSFWILLCALAGFGVAIGGVFPVWTASVAWLFGTLNYGKVMGMTIIGTQIFTIINIRFVGVVYDRTSSYTPAFVTFIALMIFATLLFRSIRPNQT